MTYQEAVEWLSRFQFHGIKPGLERIQELLFRLGHPEKRLCAVHIAGTNGKGSTGAILETLLRYHGVKTGLYTSPHLLSVRERFLVNGLPIPEERFAQICERISQSLKGLPVTYFELTTAIAFLYFAEEGVDLAIIECGLGGRLDATNVVEPVVSVITSVGLDHQAYLGHTLSQIAYEKAGIIKTGCPLVIGPLPEEALKVVQKRAQERSAPLWRFGEKFRVFPCRGGLFYQGEHQLPRLALSLKGKFQRINLGLALKTHELLEKAGFPFEEALVRRALKKVVWPGRYERFKVPRLVILDGAHNIEGLRALQESLQEDGIERYHLLFAASNEGEEKPYFDMLRLMLGRAEKVFLCEPPGPRHPVRLEDWQEKLQDFDMHAWRCEFILVRAWEEALEKALLENTPPLVVTGSLYLVGKVREALQRRIMRRKGLPSSSAWKL